MSDQDFLWATLSLGVMPATFLLAAIPARIFRWENQGGDHWGDFVAAAAFSGWPALLVATAWLVSRLI